MGKYTTPDQWGPTWSTLPAQRGGPPPWAFTAGRSTGSVDFDSFSIGSYGGWVSVGTRGDDGFPT
jgi:hypothetical protein